MAVLPIDDTPNAPLLAAAFAILACALLWYLLKRYKNFKPSKLFVKNPNLSLLLFSVENLSLGAFQRVFGVFGGVVFLERACRQLERGACICVRARLYDRFRDLILCLMKRKLSLCAFRGR